jgi:hypothetical protein
VLLYFFAMTRSKMKSTFVLLSMLAALSVTAVVSAAPNNNGSVKVEGDAMVSTLDGVGGTVHENGNVLELKNGELSLNGIVVYKKKGVLKVRLVHKGATFSLTVNGKNVPLPDIKQAPALT